MVALAAVSGAVTYKGAAAPKDTVRLAVLPFETDASNRALSGGLLTDTAERLRDVRGKTMSIEALLMDRGPNICFYRCEIRGVLPRLALQPSIKIPGSVAGARGG